MSQFENILMIGGIALLIAGIINIITLRILHNSHQLKEQASKEWEETFNLRKVMLEERQASKEG